MQNLNQFKTNSYHQDVLFYNSLKLATIYKSKKKYNEGKLKYKIKRATEFRFKISIAR